MKTTTRASHIVDIKDEVIDKGSYRMDWNTNKMVKIERVVLEIGQKVFFNAAYNDIDGWFVCTEEPFGDKYATQQLVEIGGQHRKMKWDVGMHDRSVDQVFGIGLYYDTSGERMSQEEINLYVHHAEVQERWNVRRAANVERSNEEEKKALRKQWAGVLVPLADINDWKEREKQEKANILNYLKYHFKGVKFTARKTYGTYCISWTDGPKESDVAKICQVWHDHDFNSYEDYNEYKPSNFNRVFGGVKYSVDTNRNDSDARIAEAREKLLSICPEFADKIDTHEAYKLSAGSQSWLDMTVNRHRDNEDARLFEQCGHRSAIDRGEVYPYDLINKYLDEQDCMPKVEEVSKKAESKDAPAGLHVVKIDGGVAVVGDDWKDTYFNKREIKAHGCTWNKERKQWEATTADAIAMVCDWLGEC